MSAIIWSQSAGVFGAGWCTSILGGVPALLVPHVAGDGSGRIYGYALMLDHRRLALIPDTDPDRARAEAERILAEHEMAVLETAKGA
jgi:hypothetical protein